MNNKTMKLRITNINQTADLFFASKLKFVQNGVVV